MISLVISVKEKGLGRLDEPSLSSSLFLLLVVLHKIQLKSTQSYNNNKKGLIPGSLHIYQLCRLIQNLQNASATIIITKKKRKERNSKIQLKEIWSNKKINLYSNRRRLGQNEPFIYIYNSRVQSQWLRKYKLKPNCSKPLHSLQCQVQ